MIPAKVCMRSILWLPQQLIMTDSLNFIQSILGSHIPHRGNLKSYKNTATLQAEAAQTTCWSIQARLPVASTWQDEEPSTIGPKPSRMIRSAKEQFSWCREPVQRCLVDISNMVLHFPLALWLQREASQY